MYIMEQVNNSRDSSYLISVVAGVTLNIGFELKVLFDIVGNIQSVSHPNYYRMGSQVY